MGYFLGQIAGHPLPMRVTLEDAVKSVRIVAAEIESLRNRSTPKLDFEKIADGLKND